MLASASRCSANENASAMSEATGRAIIKPARSGRLPANHDESVIMADAMENFRIVISKILFPLKSRGLNI